MPEIEVHLSIEKRVCEEEVQASLRANRLDPKLLYVTPRQTELWRQVFLRHSPIHGNPEFARIYQDAFAQAIALMAPGAVRLVGLGAGTGLKEAELCAELRRFGHEVHFSTIDVSRKLVEEAADRLAGAGAISTHHLVCDLAEIGFLKQWLDRRDRQTPRLFTFFGIVPNLEPQHIARLFQELLRPGDLLLFSVHLAPVGEGGDLDAAMKRILPQYDNPETLAWLRAAMDQWNLVELMEEPQICVGEMKTVPCITAIARWKSYETYLKFAPHAGAFTDISFRLFLSLRYTPALVEELLQFAGVQGRKLAITACGEEGIWSVQRV